MYVNVFLMVFSCLFTPEGHPPVSVGDPTIPRYWSYFLVVVMWSSLGTVTIGLIVPRPRWLQLDAASIVSVAFRLLSV